MDTEAQLELILHRARQVERAARLRALLLTLIPAVVGVLLVGLTFWQVNAMNQQLEAKKKEVAAVQSELRQSTSSLAMTSDQLDSAQQEVDVVKAELARSRDELSTVQGQLESSQKQLALTSDELKIAQDQLNEANAQVITLKEEVQELLSFREYKFPEHWEVTLKNLYNRYYNSQPFVSLLDEIDSNIRSHFPWNPTGFSPEKGFNSPSFAGFVLSETGLLRGLKEPITTQSQLMNALPARRGSPRPGDVVFYKTGYSMFYFEDEQGNPFVIGMTPRGVMPMDYTFGTVIGIGATAFK